MTTVSVSGVAAPTVVTQTQTPSVGVSGVNTQPVVTTSSAGDANVTVTAPPSPQVVGINQPSAPVATVTAPATPPVVEVVSVGPQGPSSSGVAVEVASQVYAGQPVRPNASGKLVLAQADTMANARQVSLAGNDAAGGYTARCETSFITLSDWTAATGSVALVPQAQYFLSATTPGVLVVSPPTTGVVLVVGIAVSSTTMAIMIGLPIKL